MRRKMPEKKVSLTASGMGGYNEENEAAASSWAHSRATYIVVHGNSGPVPPRRDPAENRDSPVDEANVEIRASRAEE